MEEVNGSQQCPSRRRSRRGGRVLRNGEKNDTDGRTPSFKIGGRKKCCEPAKRWL